MAVAEDNGCQDTTCCLALAISLTSLGIGGMVNHIARSKLTCANTRIDDVGID